MLQSSRTIGSDVCITCIRAFHNNIFRGRSARQWDDVVSVPEAIRKASCVSSASLRSEGFDDHPRPSVPTANLAALGSACDEAVAAGL